LTIGIAQRHLGVPAILRARSGF